MTGLSFMSKPYGIIALSPWLFIFPFIPGPFIKKIKITIAILLSAMLTVLIIYPPFLFNPLSIIKWFSEWFDIQNQFNKLFPQDALNKMIYRFKELFLFFFMTKNKTGIVYSNWMNILFFFIFSVSLIFNIKKKKFPKPVETLIFSTALGFTVTGLFYLYRNWDRYFLPYLFINAFLFGYMIRTLISCIKKITKT